MNHDSLKLTVYFGEAERVGHELLSDALMDLFEEHELRAAVLMRAAEGFGLGRTLHTDRLLTLSEDLPLVAVAVDERAAIERALPRVTELVGDGLVTLERARLLDSSLDSVAFPEELDEATKLTIYLGRDEPVGDRPGFLATVEHLHASGLAGATVLLGVDGMAHRERRRARFFSRNRSVPLMIVSVGTGETIRSGLRGLEGILAQPVVTLERVRVCKRDGRLLAEPRRLPTEDESGLGVWQRLMVFASEQAHHDGRPLSGEIVRRLRAEGASGATSVRGIWGFSGDHPPHGDRLFRVRRRIPVVTSIVDTPERIGRWFSIVDRCTAESGLVTSEMVPAFRASAEALRVGGLTLANLPRLPD